MTREPVGEIRPVKQSHAMKPRGLWYGFGASWLEWCASEQPDWIGEHFYEVRLADHASVLRIESAGALQRFAHEYEAPSPVDGTYIDWPRVCSEYDAIEINPYQWSCRLQLGMTWYYGWDVASGCVWNPSIVSVSEAARPPAALEAPA